MENSVLLEEGVKCGTSCPECKSSNFQFLPDISYRNRDYGRLKIYQWKCHNCNKTFAQVEKKLKKK